MSCVMRLWLVSLTKHIVQLVNIRASPPPQPPSQIVVWFQTIAIAISAGVNAVMDRSKAVCHRAYLWFP